MLLKLVAVAVWTVGIRTDIWTVKILATNLLRCHQLPRWSWRM